MPFDSDNGRQAVAEHPAAPPVNSTSTEAKKHRYHQRYAELKSLGETFFPHTIFKDAVASLVIFLILIALAVFVGAPLEERADPGNTAYVPRPEWYFMALFQLLKYFPGSLEWVGVAVVPGALVLFLVLLPVLDRKWVRHPRQRTFAMNLTAAVVAGAFVLTFQAYDLTPTTAVSLLTDGPRLVPAPRASVAQARLTAAQEQGKRLFQSQNCASCHTLNGSGGKVGPDLTQIGARREASWLHEYIEKPKNVNPNATMPAFIPPMSHQEVEWLAQYLATLR